jgi:hypothetical protein
LGGCHLGPAGATRAVAKNVVMMAVLEAIRN